MMERKKLIEVALPLDDINAACSREKSIRHGHPSTLHLWWARRPLAAARAVIFASLVDDPSSHPELFPTNEEQDNERRRLFRIISDLVVWENSNDPDVLGRAHEEIMKYTDGNPPAFLDPFAGGGALPLEAQRLGLKVYACDLNPVAVMINKAMVEIPSRFQNKPPVNPSQQWIEDGWDRCTGMAKDIEYYGEILKQKAFDRIGNLYPQVEYEEGGSRKKATVIAWLWARTVKCPNPACGCEIPLIKSFNLASTPTNKFHLVMDVDNSMFPPTIQYGIGKGLAKEATGTIGKGNVICPVCGQSFKTNYVMEKGLEKQIGNRLIAIVAEGESGRLYLPPSSEMELSAMVTRPEEVPSISLVGKAKETSIYGFDTTDSLFTNRQLVLITTLIDLLDEIEEQVNEDIKTHDFYERKNYSAAIRTYLAFVIDKMTDYHSSFCSWHSSRQLIRNVFGRQAIPMVWDYAEANPFCNSSGCLSNMLEWVAQSVQSFPVSIAPGFVAQWDATQDVGLRDIMISTDPPYYDNICYADLSDFFFVWMKQSLKTTYPELFSTIAVPKEDELVASPYRFENKQKAKDFFEGGMEKTCRNLFMYSRSDIPVTVYYAFKQSDADSDDEKASSGWETMLSAIINAGFTITGTLPLNTELGNRLVASGSNALASSIIIVCRKAEKLSSISSRGFTEALHNEIAPSLVKLQSANIAPVDLAQSSIGPGIAVFSRYKSVIKSDGSELSVREALKLINKELDAHLDASTSFMDPGTSFCMALYQQKGFNFIQFGEADTLARSKNISVEGLARIGAVESSKGQVSLTLRESLPEFNPDSSCFWLLTQQAVHASETKGFDGIGRIFSQLPADKVDRIKSICYQLFSVADGNGWAQEALAYNTVIANWDATVTASSNFKKESNKNVQPELGF